MRNLLSIALMAMTEHFEPPRGGGQSPPPAAPAQPAYGDPNAIAPAEGSPAPLSTPQNVSPGRPLDTFDFDSAPNRYETSQSQVEARDRTLDEARAKLDAHEEADQRERDRAAGSATEVTWPKATTGVAGTQALHPGDAGALTPGNIPPAAQAKDIKWVWARFKQMAHIPPGRTVRPGEIAQVPEDHLHPDVHEELDPDDEAIPGNGPAVAPKDEDDKATADRDGFQWLHRRIQALEEEVFDRRPPKEPAPATRESDAPVKSDPRTV